MYDNTFSYLNKNTALYELPISYVIILNFFRNKKRKLCEPLHPWMLNILGPITVMPTNLVSKNFSFIA